MSGELEIGGTCIGGGGRPTIALSVTDILDTGSVAVRMGNIIDRTSGLESFDAVCIRNDSGSPDAFAETVAIVASLWSGGLILDSDDPAAILMAAGQLGDRRPLITMGSSPGDGMMTAGMLGCPVVVRSDSMEELMDLSAEASGAGVGVALDPAATNMKQCLERNTDLHRLATRIPEANHPVVTRAWSGEYALAMGTVSIVNHASLVILDDLDRDSCVVIDRVSRSMGAAHAEAP